MSVRKWLIKLNNRLEKTWDSVDTTLDNISLKEGWYVSEYVVKASVTQTPRLIIERKGLADFERSLEGYHVGRNRMLLCLPDGQLKAYSQSVELVRLARVSNVEGRARVLLICGRYLVDFFSVPVVLRMLVMQFQNRFELSNAILNFYSPVKETYLQNVYAWSKFRGFAPALKWLSRGVKVAVLVENEAQKPALRDLAVAPDYILSVSDSLPDDVDYLIPLNEGMRLRDSAVLMFKRYIRKSSRSLSLVYSDHDYEFDENSGDIPQEPVFKPQPSLAYLYCFNYIGPAVMFSSRSIESANLGDLLNAEYRYELALSCFQKLDSIGHLSEALFVGRDQALMTTPEPTTQTSVWPNINWQRRDGYNALTADLEWQNKPSIDLVIPTRDGLKVLKPCIESLLAVTDYPNFKIIIVDNGSELAETHEFFAEVIKNPLVSVIEYPGEFNYSAINNFAVAHGESDYVGLVNNDIEVIHANWLTNMMVWATQSEVGIVGAKLLFGNGLVQHAGVTIGMGNAAGHIHRLEEGDSPGYQYRCLATQNMMAVTAACLITPRALFEQNGGLNEVDYKVAYNDIDYCLRIEEQGLHVIWTPEARLYHHESVSRGDDLSDTHVERYFKELGALQRRWKTKGFVDKYYSKHLRIGDEGVYPQVESSEPDELVYVSNAGGQENNSTQVN